MQQQNRWTISYMEGRTGCWLGRREALEMWGDSSGMEGIELTSYMEENLGCSFSKDLCCAFGRGPLLMFLWRLYIVLPAVSYLFLPRPGQTR